MVGNNGGILGELSNESVEKLFYVSAQELKKRPLKAGPNAPISGGP